MLCQLRKICGVCVIYSSFRGGVSVTSPSSTVFMVCLVLIGKYFWDNFQNDQKNEEIRRQVYQAEEEQQMEVNVLNGWINAYAPAASEEQAAEQMTQSADDARRATETIRVAPVRWDAKGEEAP